MSRYDFDEQKSKLRQNSCYFFFKESPLALLLTVVIPGWSHRGPWRTILHLLTRRTAESIVFSESDRHVLWNSAEDDLLVQAVTKYSTSDVFGPVSTGMQVESSLSVSLPQQFKEYYRLDATVTQLTFVFLPAHAHRCLDYRNNTVSTVAIVKLIHD